MSPELVGLTFTVAVIGFSTLIFGQFLKPELEKKLVTVAVIGVIVLFIARAVG